MGFRIEERYMDGCREGKGRRRRRREEVCDGREGEIDGNGGVFEVGEGGGGGREKMRRKEGKNFG